VEDSSLCCRVCCLSIELSYAEIEFFDEKVPSPLQRSQLDRYKIKILSVRSVSLVTFGYFYDCRRRFQRETRGKRDTNFQESAILSPL